MIDALNKYTDKNEKVGYINSLKDIDAFYHRHLMSDYMNNFCNESLNTNLKEVNEKLGTKSYVPVLKTVDLKDVCEEEKLFEFLEINKLELPLIIKHSGPVEFCHLLVCIVSKGGIKNYLDFVKEKAKLYNINDISLVIQHFVNHGGYFIKLFYINGKSFPYVRPSLPDLSPDLENTTEKFKHGFYSFITDDLLTKSYLDFWKGQQLKSVKIEDLISRDYLQGVCDSFKNFSGISMFGLDLIYNYSENIYYLVDMNYFPGYKELKMDFSDLMIQHVVKIKKSGFGTINR